ncbi:hypothetical protein B0H63DRAFT_261115 [Podospora didyma]|uniref:Uncharacterized protein n=1 Tax=Podospora didyma TaxID=330526 RepID=A0AAE0KE24_9PEZI|nr:hypothetical protein B0H63DRAFT_261115 [Podospora didyma]
MEQAGEQSSVSAAAQCFECLETASSPHARRLFGTPFLPAVSLHSDDRRLFSERSAHVVYMPIFGRRQAQAKGSRIVNVSKAVARRVLAGLWPRRDENNVIHGLGKYGSSRRAHVSPSSPVAPSHKVSINSVSSAQRHEPATSCWDELCCADCTTEMRPERQQSDEIFASSLGAAVGLACSLSNGCIKVRRAVRNGWLTVPCHSYLKRCPTSRRN